MATNKTKKTVQRAVSKVKSTASSIRYGIGVGSSNSGWREGGSNKSTLRSYVQDANTHRSLVDSVSRKPGASYAGHSSSSISKLRGALSNTNSLGGSIKRAKKK